jgi:hypothetical protein
MRQWGHHHTYITGAATGVLIYGYRPWILGALIYVAGVASCLFVFGGIKLAKRLGRRERRGGYVHRI